MLPNLHTARYFAEDVLTSGEVQPVRCSEEPPIIPLLYQLETAWSLLPALDSFGDSPKLSHSYWRALDRTGLGKIAGELSEIAVRHGGKPLVLCDYSDVEKGHGSPRLMFARWWEFQTGQEVTELTADGREVHHSELPAQVQVEVPQPRTEDPRWRESTVRTTWPWSHADFAEWVTSRYWQAARSKQNPHEYSLRQWDDDLPFELAVLYIREHGYQHKFGSRWYTQYDLDGRFYWSMGAPLSSSSLINRKWLGQDEEGFEAPAEPNLFDGGMKEEEREHDRW